MLTARQLLGSRTFYLFAVLMLVYSFSPMASGGGVIYVNDDAAPGGNGVKLGYGLPVSTRWIGRC